jgi:hypothetical protein
MTDHDLLGMDPRQLSDHDLLIRHDERLDGFEKALIRIENAMRWPLRAIGNAVITAVVAALVAAGVAALIGCK